MFGSLLHSGTPEPYGLLSLSGTLPDNGSHVSHGAHQFLGSLTAYGTLS